MFRRNGWRSCRGWRTPLRVVAAGVLLVPFGCAGGGKGRDGAPRDETAPADVPATSETPVTTLAELAVPAGVGVFIEFPRYLHAQRRLEVGFDNRLGDTELTVTELVLRSPLFEPIAPDDHDTGIVAGRRRDLQIGLGPPVCPAPPGPSMVEITAEIGGVSRHGLVEIDPAPLERISATECGREYVLQRFDLGYRPEFVVTDGVVQATVDIGRVDGHEPLTVDSMRGSVLLDLRPAAPGDPLAVITGADEDVSIPVSLRVIRCDPHAVIESKKTFELMIWVTVGNGETQDLVVAPSGQLRSVLEQLIDDCLRQQSG